METAELIKLINTLTKLTQETEWVEFKHNFHSSEEIGERLSALSNSACLCNKPYGYLIFGIDDTTHKVVGTTFKAKSHKKGNEAYFDLMKLPMPTTQQAIIEKFKTEQLVAEDETGLPSLYFLIVRCLESINKNGWRPVTITPDYQQNPQTMGGKGRY